MENQEIIEPQ